MSQLSPVLYSFEGNRVGIWCPGCDEAHVIVHGGAGWSWDGNAERPTFAPSLLVRSGHHADGKHPCWCTYNRDHPDDPSPFKCGVCHSFVRAGRIEFLSDCTHALAGQTVPLPPWPEVAR